MPTPEPRMKRNKETKPKKVATLYSPIKDVITKDNTAAIRRKKTILKKTECFIIITPCSLLN